MEMLFPGAFLETQILPIPHMHVPISAHITARARQSLYDWMIQCREVYYCDTDGFATRELLSTGKELGDLKLEKKISSARFEAPKVYAIQGLEWKSNQWEEVHMVKAKGFSRLNVDRFYKILDGAEISFERMGRIREMYRKGVDGTVPKSIQVRKRLRMENHVTKRFQYPDGHSRPWHIEELAEHAGKQRNPPKGRK